MPDVTASRLCYQLMWCKHNKLTLRTMNRIHILPVKSSPIQPKVFNQLLGGELNKHKLMRNVPESTMDEVCHQVHPE